VLSAKCEVRSATCGVVVIVLLALRTVPVLGATDVPGFDAFRIVWERNIFDSYRHAPEPARAPKPPAPPRADRLTLTGVLISERGAVGFFEGTEPEYNVDVEKGGMIAGYRVGEIRTDCVKLTREGRQIELPVGSGLSKQEGGEWELSSSASSSSLAGWTSEAEDRAATEPSSSGNIGEAQPGSESLRDILKKLRERREQEFNR